MLLLSLPQSEVMVLWQALQATAEENQGDREE
jgi:hypothetical protein